MRPWFVWTMLVVGACGGDDGVHHLPDAPPPPIDAPGGDAQPVTAQGFIAATLTTATGGTSPTFETYLHAWAPGIADPDATFGAYYDKYGSAAGLAIGACAPIALPPFTRFDSLIAGANLTLTGGPAPLPLTGPDTVGYYYGFDDGSAGTAYTGQPLAINLGAGSEAVGGPGTLTLGSLPEVAIGAEPQPCSRSVDCAFDATVGQVDRLYVTAGLDTICRVDPAVAPTLPKDAFSTRPDGIGTVRIIGLRRVTAQLGGGSYVVFLWTERTMIYNLSP